MATKPYQVYHEIGGPHRRLIQMHTGAPPPRFPDDYVPVAHVQANSLRQAVALTVDQENVLHGTVTPWDRNPGVTALPSILWHRSTDQGDVVVDPQGKAYRVEANGFLEIPVGNYRETARTELFKELRADYAAAKRPDAHPGWTAAPGALPTEPPPPQPTRKRPPERGRER